MRATATLTHERVATASPPARPAANRKYCIRSARLGPRWRPARSSTYAGPPTASTMGSEPMFHIRVFGGPPMPTLRFKVRVRPR
eukprot:9166161-Lingulodinium_polyedra.AAC.1